MSAAEIFVFVLCLFVGYWLVSRLLERRPPRRSEDTASRDPRPAADAATTTSAPQSPAGHGEYLPRSAHVDARATLANWYQVLGVRETADQAAIEAACQRRLALYPPSALAMMSPERRAAAEANIAQIKAAYELGMRLFRR
jgi:DnaJ-domain-containing protein 1